MFRLKFSAAVCLAALCSVPLHAQSITGSIVGTVVDPGRLAVPAANVTLVNAGTAEKRVISTGETGGFVFSGLQPGEYNLTVEAGGFKRYEKRGMNLTAAETLAAGQIMLEVGAVSEFVEVTAEGATVQTASMERAGISKVESAIASTPTASPARRRAAGTRPRTTSWPATS